MFAHRVPSPRPISFEFICLVSLFSLLAILSACGPKPRPHLELDSVTGELIQAARKATGGSAEIRVFGSRAEVATARAGEAASAPPERLQVTLHDAGSLAAVEAGWQGVARAHGLELLKNSSNPRLVRFLCRFEGQPTHSIQVVFAGDATATSRKRGAGSSEPRLAVIIDDLGYDIPSAERVLALPFPLTVAVLPHLPHSSEVAGRAERRGFEVLLNLPMESESAQSPAEAIELHSGFDAGETSRMLDAMLATVPGAVGVNNHQGSRATADSALMKHVIAALAARHLFLIDSRTTSSSVAFDAARAAGLPAAYRTEFLDDVQEPAAILAQLERAERRAKETGWAVAIGHPYRVTVNVLTDALPDLEVRGVRLVRASEIVQR